MNPADATTAWSVVEPAYSSTQAGVLQPFKNHVDTTRGRHIMVVCDGDPRRRENHQAAFAGHGNEVVTCDPMQPYTSTQFEQLLSQAAVVRFDCSDLNLNAVKRLLHVAHHRQRHGMKPFFVCTAIRRYRSVYGADHRDFPADGDCHRHQPGGHDTVGICARNPFAKWLRGERLWV